jgi:8-oxo-dGTP pyrophosphatase MutT (NUDIX family)
VKPSPVLPPLPVIRLSGEGTPDGAPFLSITRQLLRAHFPDGTQSQAFAYDSVDRRALDAVVIVAWECVEGEVCVHLRSAVRPPLLERATHPAAADRQAEPGLWELPAGLIEPTDFVAGQTRTWGVLMAAARELREELGFVAEPSAFCVLGPGVFPSPAMTAEKQFFVSVNVTGQRRDEPLLDGSPLEEHAAMVLVPLNCALMFCNDGTITDSKTELALRRLATQDLVASSSICLSK